MAHCGEWASLLFTRQRYASHTGMLYAAFVLAAIRAQDPLPGGAVQQECHCCWSWSQTILLAGTDSSFFSVLSHTSPILGLCPYLAKNCDLRSDIGTFLLGCKTLVLQLSPSRPAFCRTSVTEELLISVLLSRDSSRKLMLRTMKCSSITRSALDKQMNCVWLFGGCLMPRQKWEICIL